LVDRQLYRRNASPKAIVAEIERHPVKPGVETCRTRSPIWGEPPRSEERFLRDILGLDLIAKDATGQREYPWRLAGH
jgi:hypothetical protein